MSPVLLLRVAAGLAAIQGFAHGALFIRARPRFGAAEEAVIEAMKTNRFRGGLGYWDFYFGYGLIAAAICLVEAILFWQLAGIARAQPQLVRPPVALFVVWNVVHALLLTRYFKLPLPIGFDVLVALVLVLAYAAAGGAKA